MELDKINSMTKYPSILTYHAMGAKGILKNEVQIPFDEPALLTEKIDGVNGRIIVFPDGRYIIGSRDELLYAKGDLIGNPQLGIIETLKPVAERLASCDEITVYYLEVYGGRAGNNSKQYSKKGTMGCRLFDVATIPDADTVLGMSVEKIASWRDHGGQKFWSENELDQLDLPKTPRLGVGEIPMGLEETYEWMKRVITVTQAPLDDSALGRPEGIVARTMDRSVITKLRFEDYERYFRHIEGN